jgi:hypothetical protein
VTGYAIALAPCIGCGRVFGFNPHRVPSVIVDGVREPVCRTCVDRANDNRKASGLPLFTVYPDSYEPIEEGGL